MESRTLGIIAAAIIIIPLAVLMYPEREVTHPPGVLCPEEPVQTRIDKAKPFLHGDYMITPLAEFSLEGRVLSREDYRWGGESGLAPVDLAMGWDAMSDQAVVDKLDISQGSRWYRWKPFEALPIPRRQVELCSANMHIVPATDEVEDVLDDVCRGNIIAFKGYLVKITRDGNWRWVSSLTREDTGDGACEVVYVEELRIIS